MEKKAKYYSACMQWKVLGKNKSPEMRGDTVLAAGTQRGMSLCYVNVIMLMLSYMCHPFMLMLGRLIISDLNNGINN